MRGVAAILLVGHLTACASGTPIQTASGKLDVTLKNVDRQCVRLLIFTHTLADGWNLRSTDGVQTVLERETEESFAKTMLSTANGPPQKRITYSLLPSGDNVRLVVDLAVVSNVGTPAEHVRLIPPNQELQEALEEAGRRAEAACSGKNNGRRSR